ncbi:MAG: YraN family protein [Pseudomonadota bacterium]|nr:YraN family protein [Pseudomonadota bacterium]
MTSDARPPIKEKRTTTKALGDVAEARALAHLVASGLLPVERNYRVARGPGSRGGEIDLIAREPDGTLVFVEVRARRDSRFGGAAASVGIVKRQRLLFAARHYLSRFRMPPPCRFDVVTVEADRIEWLRAAFDAS